MIRARDARDEAECAVAPASVLRFHNSSDRRPRSEEFRTSNRDSWSAAASSGLLSLLREVGGRSTLSE